MTRRDRPPYQEPAWRRSPLAHACLAVITVGGLVLLVLAVGAWVLP